MSRFLFAVHGTRGDVEPCAAAARELARRGHSVAIAVPPDLVHIPKSVGLETYAFGPDSRVQLDESLNFWRVQNPLAFIRAARDYLTDSARDMSATLKPLARDVDLLVVGVNFHEVVANIAEYYDIPFAAMHWSPMHVTGHAVPGVPAPINRLAARATLSIKSLLTLKGDKAQRAELGLPRRRVSKTNPLEIQTYDEFFYPGIAMEWKDFNRPFVGALSLELPTEADDEVIGWIGRGKPPIYFGFGSMPVKSTQETVEIISAACLELGERCLIFVRDPGDLVPASHVKLVGELNLARILPLCRAAVHHGGWGTTMAGLRAGLPTLILWHGAEQPLFGWHVRRLKVGSFGPLAGVTQKSLVKKLRAVLSPDCALRARQLAHRITSNSDSVRATADLLEQHAITERNSRSLPRVP